MCVICVVDKKRPDDEFIEACFRTNPDGAGIAWREEDLDTLDAAGQPTTIIKWAKGLNLEEIQEYALASPLPYVMHFRIGTCGGKVPEMTHPFPIDEGAMNALGGSTNGSVLFHNGHFSDWRKELMSTVKAANIKLPKGPWSDSRVMAWMIALYGDEIAELFDEKLVLFGPNQLRVCTGNSSSWTRHEDVLVSNTLFVSRGYGSTVGYGSVYHGTGEKVGQSSYYGPGVTSKYCHERSCTSTTLDKDGWCFRHQSLKPKELQTGKFVPAHGMGPITTVILAETGDDEVDTSVVKEAKELDSQAGGTDAKLPFVEVQKLLAAPKEGKPWEVLRISKNAWKRLRKAQTSRTGEMGKTLPFHRETDPPILIKH